MIKSPKEKFQSSQVRTGQWAQIVANPIFDEAIDAALLQMNQNESYDSGLEAATRAHLKIIGAQDYIRILKTIHEKSETTKEPTVKGLNYNAGV